MYRLSVHFLFTKEKDNGVFFEILSFKQPGAYKRSERRKKGTQAMLFQ